MIIYLQSINSSFEKDIQQIAFILGTVHNPKEIFILDWSYFVKGSKSSTHPFMEDEDKIRKKNQSTIFR